MSTWDKIINNPEFQKETLENKVAVRDSYFNDVMLPKVEAAGEDVEAIRASFVQDNDFGTDAPAQPKELTNTDRALNRVGDAFSQLGSLASSILPTTNVEGLNNLTNPVEEEPVPIADDADWDTILSDPEFKKQSPLEKRRIADAYFDQEVAPKLQPDELETTRERFKVNSGLPTVDATGVAAEQQGALAKGKDVVLDAGDWLLNSDNKIDEVSDFSKKVGKGLTNITLSEVPGQVWDSLKEMGASMGDYIEEANNPMTDEEFKRQYFVPESETGNALSTLDRLKYKQAFQARESGAIDAARQGVDGLPEVVSSAEVREEAEREGATSRFNNITDVATMVPGLQGMKGATLAQKLGSLAAATTKTSLATGAGEVVKNVAEGREASQGVGEAMTLDALLSVGGEAAVGAVKSPTKRSSAAAESVVEGKAGFDRVLEDAAITERLDTEMNSVLKGEAKESTQTNYKGDLDYDRSVFRDLGTIDPTLPTRMEAVNKAAKESSDKFEAVFKKSDTPEEFIVNLQKAGIKQVGDEVAKDWFRLRNGDFKDVIKVAKESGATASELALNNPAIANYLRASELDSLGKLGRLFADVSNTEGASLLSKATGKLQGITNLGWTGAIRDALKDSTDKRLVSKSQDAIQEGYEKLMSDVYEGTKESAQARQFAKETQPTAEKAFKDSLQSEMDSIKEMAGSIKKEMEVEQDLYSKSRTEQKDLLKKKEYELFKEVRAEQRKGFNEDEWSSTDWVRVGELNQRLEQLREIMDNVEPNSPLLREYDEALDLLREEWFALQSKQDRYKPTKETLDAEALQLEQAEKMDAIRQIKMDSMSALNSRRNKTTFSNEDVVKAAPAMDSLGMDWMGIGNRPDSIAAQEGLNRAIAALAGRGKSTAKKLSGGEIISRTVGGTLLLNFLGMPAILAKSTLIIANGLAQASQKRGLVKGIKALRKSVDETNALKAEGKLTKADETRIQTELNKALKAEGLLAKSAPLVKVLEEATRLAERQDEE